MSKHVFPHAPSPTMTSLRRISAICAVGQCNSNLSCAARPRCSGCSAAGGDVVSGAVKRFVVAKGGGESTARLRGSPEAVAGSNHLQRPRLRGEVQQTQPHTLSERLGGLASFCKESDRMTVCVTYEFEVRSRCCGSWQLRTNTGTQVCWLVSSGVLGPQLLLAKTPLSREPQQSRSRLFQDRFAQEPDLTCH
jgi:hypothetical protein